VRRWVGLAVGLGLVALGAWRVQGALQARRQAAAPQAPRFAVVQVGQASVGSVVQEAAYSGDVQATSTVEVVARIPGVVAEVLVGDGDRVQAGQMLVRLDPRELRYDLQRAAAARDAQAVQVRQAEANLRTLRVQVEQARAALQVQQARLHQLLAGSPPEQVRQAEEQVRQAQASLEFAQAQLRRAEELFRQGFVAQQAVDAARTEVAVQEARLRAAEQQLALLRRGPSAEEVEVARGQVRQAEVALRQAQAQASQAEVALEHARRLLTQAEVNFRQVHTSLAESLVRAPVAGVVAARAVDPGDTVSPSTRLLQVVRTDPAVVAFPVPERELGALQRGSAVEVTADAVPGRVFTGRVAGTNPLLSPETRTAEVKVEVPNPEGLLRPGMTARVRAVLARRDGVVTVPVEAVLRRSGRAVVFVVEGDVAREREVTTGLSDGRRVEVRTGIGAGERVVVAGQETLRDGVTVRTPEGLRVGPSRRRRQP